MNQVSKPTTTRLAHRAILALPARAGDRIDCLTGSVWITQHGNPSDVFLDAGQSFTLDRAGTAVVEALARAAVAVQRAAPSSWRASTEGVRAPLSFAAPAFAAIATWLLLAVWPPAGDLRQAQARAPRPSLPAVTHAAQAWPAPAIDDEAALLAQPAPTF